MAAVAAGAAAAVPAGGAALRLETCPPGAALAGLLAGAWGRPNTVAAAALTAATEAAVVAAAVVAAAAAAVAAAVAVPLAALLVASEAADPLARGSPAHVNGLNYSLVIKNTIVLGFNSPIY